MKNSKEAQALAALVSSSTVRQASAASGIPERTLWRLLEKPDFSARLEQEKEKLISTASDSLKAKVHAATRAIADVMEDADAPAAARITAAKTILEYALRYAEMADVIHRLDELERQMAADSGA